MPSAPSGVAALSRGWQEPGRGVEDAEMGAPSILGPCFYARAAERLPPNPRACAGECAPPPSSLLSLCRCLSSLSYLLWQIVLPPRTPQSISMHHVFFSMATSFLSFPPQQCKKHLAAVAMTLWRWLTSSHPQVAGTPFLSPSARSPRGPRPGDAAGFIFRFLELSRRPPFMALALFPFVSANLSAAQSQCPPSPVLAGRQANLIYPSRAQALRGASQAGPNPAPWVARWARPRSLTPKDSKGRGTGAGRGRAPAMIHARAALGERRPGREHVVCCSIMFKVPQSH